MTRTKAATKVIPQNIIVGKDVLELLSSSMYINPLTIYREYVQNAADAIDTAIAQGALSPEDARIDITMDPATWSIKIRDNGSGVENKSFTKRMTSLGASHKRGMHARGFRGVGRLAGLGYCHELVFRSRAEGDPEVQEIHWDCKKLKTLLSDPHFEGDLSSLVREIVTVRSIEGDTYPTRFFEVELVKAFRLSNGILLNESAVENYLAQVAPVPFKPDFKFGAEIKDFVTAHVSLGEYSIFLNDAHGPIYRPYTNEVRYSDDRVGEVYDPQFFVLENMDGEPAAVGWLLHHDYQGAIPNSTYMKGLRARSGNIQVGHHNLFRESYPETRFNSWTIGELHIIDEKIMPNGRRDHFEQNNHFYNLETQLTPYLHEIGRKCRSSSEIRNRLKTFASKEFQIEENINVLAQGAVSKTFANNTRKNSSSILSEMRAISEFERMPDLLAKDLTKRINKLEKTVVKISDNKNTSSDPLMGIPEKKRRIYSEVFDLIYESAPNQTVAKSIIDKVLARIQV